MTRHNLPSHISWLLSNKVTPPAGVHAITSTPSIAVGEIACAGLAEGDPEHQIPRPSLNRPTIETANAGHDFLRPSIPPPNAPNLHTREKTKSAAEESMGRLASASRSTRPALVSQHQLATPASTTASSSLTQGYATFLRTNNGTPSSKSAVEGIERLPPSIARVLQTPQTPRRTPHPISKFNLNNVESVDLTGDDDKSLEQVSSSPSSSEVFGTSQVIWTEEAAWKPQPSVPSDPHSRGRKKRKSDEISVGSTKKEIFQNCRGGTQRRDERANSGDFMDIDDMMAFRQTPLRPQSDNSRVLSVHPTNETKAKDNFEGEYSMTETTTRVETRRCLSVNRYPSCSESPTVLRIASPPLLPKIGVQAKTDQALTPRPLSMIQITATPAKPSPTRSKQTPDKRQKRRQDRIIQDSEDEDEIFSIGGHLKGSPGPSAKSSPKIHKASGTPVWNEIPPFEVGNHKARDEKGTKPRVGSPLRPISRNAAIKQDSAPSPFQRDSPTKVIFATRHPQSSSQQTTPSTESTDDKRLASLFLKGTLTTASYYLRVKNLISQNAITSVSFTDAGEVAPPELKDERIALLTMEKSYVALEDLRERYRATIAKKVVHTSKVLEFLDIGADYSVHEEQSSLLTQEILKIERETARHLHASGAIKDGFGTGLDINDISTITPAPPSDKHEDPNAVPQGSSALGNTQVIFQTQISSLGQNVAGISSQSTREHFAVQSKSTVVSQHGSGWKFSNAPSPSPVRRTTPQEAVEQYHSGKGQSDWMRTKSDLRQPNFSRGPIPVDFPSDGDNAILEDWLRDEQEIQHVNRIRRAVPDDLDDYGECDDDDDMVEFAQEVEHRHSLGEVDLNANPRVALPHASGSIPEPEPLKRTPPVVGRSMYSNVDQDNAAAKRTPWYKEVKKALRERFKLKGFRHHQLDAINATLEGKDAFVLMPTGGGKSLCYQLPAVVQTGKTKGVTVVISPLLSLMSDQVDHLRKLNIRAATLNSEIPADQKREIMNHLREFCPEQFIELLYITPEMINLSGTIQNLLTKLHKNKKLARIVIDEAHCVSQWGHDFRPDYVALGKVRKLFPNVPYMALTATATENVKVDVMHNLGMKDATVYSQSFNRPNLHYAVRSKKGKGKAKEFLDDVVELINREYRNQTGIIYTLSRKSCEQLAKMLQTQYGINAHHFHASMTADDKARVQRQWQNGTIKVVIATIAFGMGIDKPDVRFVIHHTIPKSLEGYYQETGRAGRDGKISGCYLYYGYPDTKILKDFIYKSEGTEEQKERQRKMLQRIVQYCENRSDCRRVQVLHYFGESFSKEECGGTCDNCKSDAVFKTEDFTPQAQAALKIVHNVQDSHVTLLHCVEILRGVATAKIKKLGHESVHGFGAASHISRGEVERIFYRLLMENALAEHNVINRGGFATQYLNLGPNCRDFMTGHRKLKLQVKVSASPTGASRQNLPFPSTILTSPISESRRRGLRAKQRDQDNEMDGYPDDFVDPDSEDEEEYFEPVQPRGKQREATPAGLGPPVTTDERMEALPELHRVFVCQFVEEAKKEVDRIKNDRNLARLFFTEANLREMAISWTVTLQDMQDIPGINVDAVKKWGRYIIPIVARYSKNYDDAMNGREDRDIDTNHQNVIDLCSEDDDEEYGLNDSEEDAILQAEQQGSKYFQTTTGATSGGHGRRMPRQTVSRGSSAAPRKNYRGANSQHRNRSRRGGSRRSGGSLSGQSSSGVSRRKLSTGAKRSGPSTASTSTALKSTDLFKKFGHQGNSRGGGGGGRGGGIGMMPV